MGVGVENSVNIQKKGIDGIWHRQRQGRLWKMRLEFNVGVIAAWEARSLEYPSGFSLAPGAYLKCIGTVLAVFNCSLHVSITILCYGEIIMLS